jgi:hypothetical protein
VEAIRAEPVGKAADAGGNAGKSIGLFVVFIWDSYYMIIKYIFD